MPTCKKEDKMKKWRIISICFFFPLSLLWLGLSGDNVSIPYSEFKELFIENIERKVTDKLEKKFEKKPEKKEAFVYTIEDASYSLAIDEQHAKGKARLSGRIISGKPEPFPVFNDLVITGINEVAGGILSTQAVTGYGNGIIFHPDDSPEFAIEISFLLEHKEDRQSAFVQFGALPAMKNSIKIELPEDSRLIEYPGIMDEQKVCHFGAEENIMVRYVFGKEIAAAATSVINLDLLSKIRFQRRRAVMSTTFFPKESKPAIMMLTIPEGASFLSSTLKPSWIKKIKGNRIELKLPEWMNDPFDIVFAWNDFKPGTKFSFGFPQIDDNNGQEGNFIIEEPDDGQVIIKESDPVSRVPVAKLSEALKGAVDKERFFMRVPPNAKINIEYNPFQAVSTPPVVLDKISFFTAFEENGNVLSVLVMDVLPEAGRRLNVKPAPGAKVWSLTVNNKMKKVYKNPDGSWIIPLTGNESSHVELAFIHKTDKLGLSGRLAAILPETGLPCRRAVVGVALPARVQLISLEGPVSPSPEAVKKPPKEFIGKPYYFSRSFYSGQGMEMALSYKEPVKK